MSDGFKIQINVKAGDELINLRADSGPEMEQIIGWATAKAPDIQAVIALLKGANNVAGALPVAGVQQNGPSWAEQGSQQSAQPAAPAQAGKQCAHGAMTYRNGNGAKGPWQAYFCPTPKGTPGQCQPEWVK